MEDQKVYRRLAAIVAMDIVGYSRMMGADEDGTLSRLKAIRSELLTPLMESHRGRLVKTTGDGFLIEFASVVDAFRFSSEVQTDNDKRVQAAPHEFAMVFRIGINVGDIIIDDGDVYGDGVNIAARLEQMSDPCGICVSDRAYRDLRNFPCNFDDLGLCDLKNIDDPIRVYRARLDQERSTRGSPSGIPIREELPPAPIVPFKTSMPRWQNKSLFLAVLIGLISTIAFSGWFVFNGRDAVDSRAGIQINDFNVVSKNLPQNLSVNIRSEFERQIQENPSSYIKLVSKGGDLNLGGSIATASKDKLNININVRYKNITIGIISDEFGKPKDKLISRRIAYSINQVMLCTLDFFEKKYMDAPINVIKSAFQYCNSNNATADLFLTRQIVNALPESSAAWAEFAYASLQIAGMQKSDNLRLEAGRAIEKSISLDRDNPTPYLYKAITISGNSSQEMMKSEEYFLKAVGFNPTYCFCAYHRYGNFLQERGRIDDSNNYIKLAVDGDKYSPSANKDAIENEMALGHYWHAEAIAREMQLLWPDEGFDFQQLRAAFAQKDGGLARAILKTESVRSAYSPQLLSKFDKIAENLESRNEVDLNLSVNSLAMLALNPVDQSQIVAQILGQFGRDVEAANIIEQLINRGEAGIELLYFPMFSNARKQPAVSRVFEKAGLTAYWKKSGKKPDFCKTEKLPQFCT